MTSKAFHELRVGDYIADMHYGTRQLEELFTILAVVRWDEPTTDEKASDGYPTHAFFRYIAQFIGQPAINKGLYVIGHAGMSLTVNVPALVCAYCYDGRRSGIVVLAEKRQESPKA